MSASLFADGVRPGIELVERPEIDPNRYQSTWVSIKDSFALC